MKSASAYADPSSGEVSTAELSLADQPTEEFAVPAPHPAPGRVRRRRVPVSVLAVLMLLIGLAAGIGAALAVRGAADSTAAPRAGGSPSAAASSSVASEPSPTSHDVIGILTAVGSRSIGVSSGSITGTYQVTSATRITRGSVVVRLQTLKVGEQVTVRLGFADSTSAALTAQAITVKATLVPKPRASARATVAPQPAVVTASPQAVVRAPATVVTPARGTSGFAVGIGSQMVGGGLGGAGGAAGGRFGGR
jgi:hypothetical protein